MFKIFKNAQEHFQCNVPNPLSYLLVLMEIKTSQIQICFCIHHHIQFLVISQPYIFCSVK